MNVSDHFAGVFQVAKQLDVKCTLVDHIVFVEVFGSTYALSYRHLDGAKPAFTLLLKSDPVYSAVDGWILDENLELTAEGRSPDRTLGHLVFTSIV